MLLTMKFGAFQIYVFAPIDTDLHETAARIFSPRLVLRRVFRSSMWPPTTPDAMALKVRYVGALSRKLESPPDIQKNCHGCLKFRDAACALRISSAGTMVTKMPRNRAA